MANLFKEYTTKVLEKLATGIKKIDPAVQKLRPAAEKCADFIFRRFRKFLDTSPREKQLILQNGLTENMRKVTGIAVIIQIIAAFFAFWADKQPSLKGVNIYQQLYYRMSETSDFVGKDFFRTLKPWQQKRDEIVAQHKGPKLLLVANGITHRVLNMDFIRHEAARGMSCYFLYNNLLSYISLCAPKEIADQVFVNKGMKIYEDKN